MTKLFRQDSEIDSTCLITVEQEPESLLLDPLNYLENFHQVLIYNFSIKLN